MIRNQEWVNNELAKNSENIKFKYGRFEDSLTIKDQLHLKSISISDVKSVHKLILSNLANLEECRIYQCGLEELIIKNCPCLKSLKVGNNLLTNLNFVKGLTNLINLEIDGNERISVGTEHLSDNLESFSCEGTELFETLEPYQGDWKIYKQYLKEKGISEEENNKRELSSLREETKKLDKKYKVLKESVEELKNYIEEKLTLLSNKVVNDPDTKEIISNLRKGIGDITDENKRLKDEVEQFRPLFNEEAPIIEASKLGKGSFGEVYKGVWKTQFAAVKKSFANITDETELAKIRKELKILKNLRSSYTIQYYGEYQKDNDIYLIMEYAEHGSLAKFVTDNKDKDHDWQLNYNFIKQMVKGLRYLHSEGVLHRDLKSHNVLITEGYVAKLADFGLAKLLDSSNYSSDGNKIKGTLRWLAPEVLKGSKHSFESDIYSLGMVMWEIATKRILPFKDLDNDNAIIFNVGNGLRENIPNDTPDELVKIIQLCWEEKPEKRISLIDIASELNKLEAVIEVPSKN